MSLAQLKKMLLGAIVAVVLVIAGILVGQASMRNGNLSLLSPGGGFLEQKTYPLKVYSFEELVNRKPQVSPIKTERVIDENINFTTYLFSYYVEGKKMTGQLNIPMTAESRKMPVVVMVRGFVPKEIYETGVGTRNAAAYFARQGFITIAPDFLGFGESDMPVNDLWTERLSKPLHVLDLLASLQTIPQADVENVFMWGHSNGGQITLSVLEIMGNSPHWNGTVKAATLWAPMSMPFPYGILYYANELDDWGKSMRKSLAQFEADYDSDQYSIHKYYDWVKTPVQVQQGTADEPVPYKWSDLLVETLKKKGKDVQYFKYVGADHDLRGGWDTAVVRDVEFFRKHLKN